MTVFGFFNSVCESLVSAIHWSIPAASTGNALPGRSYLPEQLLKFLLQSEKWRLPVDHSVYKLEVEKNVTTDI